MATGSRQGSSDIELGVWMEALAEAQRKDDSGFTTRELSALWGCSGAMVHNRLRKLKDMGRLSSGRKLVERIDGTLNPVPVYLLKGGQQATAKRRGK